jgi:hypothetical protein
VLFRSLLRRPRRMVRARLRLYRHQYLLSRRQSQVLRCGLRSDRPRLLLGRRCVPREFSLRRQWTLLPGWVPHLLRESLRLRRLRSVPVAGSSPRRHTPSPHPRAVASAARVRSLATRPASAPFEPFVSMLDDGRADRPCTHPLAGSGRRPSVWGRAGSRRPHRA